MKSAPTNTKGINHAMCVWRVKTRDLASKFHDSIRECCWGSAIAMDILIKLDRCHWMFAVFPSNDPGKSVKQLMINTTRFTLGPSRIQFWWALIPVQGKSGCWEKSFLQHQWQMVQIQSSAINHLIRLLQLKKEHNMNTIWKTWKTLITLIILHSCGSRVNFKIWWLSWSFWSIGVHRGGCMLGVCT